MFNDKQIKELHKKLISERGKILVIQTAFLGDIILLTSLLQGIKKSFPDVELHVLTRPEGLNILREQSDNIIAFDKHERSKLNERWKELVVNLKNQKYDAALIPHRSFRSGMTALKAGIPIRIGFKRGLASRFMTHRIKYKFKTYEGERNLELLKVISDDDYDPLPRLIISEDDEKFTDNLLRSMRLKENEFAVLAPGSVWKSKCWSHSNYQRLSDIIENEYNLPVVTIGSREEVGICDKIVSEHNRNLAGFVNLMKSAAIVKRAKFLISGDTAPAHIATAVRTKQVIIFGSTSPCFGFAPDIPDTRIIEEKLWCRPCSDHGRNFCPNLGKYKCLENISADMVVEKVKDWLEG
ncbi:glycosyltransferase family 9 protein [bacterium]|nr:glycosyltransferase family 9 protein [bacterium]